MLVDDPATLILHDKAGFAAVVPSIDAAVELEVCIGCQDVEVWTLGGEFSYGLEMLGEKDVVCVEERNEIRGGRPSGNIAGGCSAAVLLPEKRDSSGIRFECFRELVGRPVVADDHLIRRNRLSQCGLHRISDERRRLVGGNDD